jgi:DNA mismatch repair protein MutL
LHGKLLPVKFSLAEYVVTGNISNPTVTFSSRNRQVSTVNGRLVKNPVLQKALSQASADAIPSGRFLAVVIDIQVPEGQVDINIHPQKLDVRFANSGFVFDILVKAIRLALSGVRGPMMMSENRVSGGEIRYQVPNLQAVSQQTDVLFQAIEWNKPQTVDVGPILNVPAVPYIQMFDTYLLVSTGSSLLVMDQHAVHERILYEQIKARSEETLYSQPLLAAEVILLTADQYSRFWESAEFFREIGFEIDDFGANQIIVRQVPVSLGGPAPERLVVEMLDSFFENPDLHWDRLMHDKDRLQRMACRAAIKAGKRMAKEEVFAMIDALIKTPGNYTCPHGRPLFLTWTKSDFEKMFLRT